MLKKPPLSLNKSGSISTNKHRNTGKIVETPIMVSKEYICQFKTQNIVKDIENNIDLREFNVKNEI